MTPVAERLSDERLEDLEAWALAEEIEATEDDLSLTAQRYADIACALTELQHRRAAEADKTNYPEIPEGWVLVPQAALDWLNGEAPDPAGMEFGEFTEEHPKPAGAFWWRKVFREIRDFYAAQRPPHAASPSSPATGVRVIEEERAKEAAFVAAGGAKRVEAHYSNEPAAPCVKVVAWRYRDDDNSPWLFAGEDTGPPDRRVFKGQIEPLTLAVRDEGMREGEK